MEVSLIVDIPEECDEVHFDCMMCGDLNHAVAHSGNFGIPYFICLGCGHVRTFGWVLFSRMTRDDGYGVCPETWELS